MTNNNPKPSLFKTWNIKIRDFIYLVKKTWKILWPINWKAFKDLGLITKSIQKAQYFWKILLGVCFAGVLISSIFLFQGFYLVLTEDTGVVGGTFNEAINGTIASKTNPILNLTSEVDKKLASLIYQPLYKVIYPDYLTDTKKDPTIEPILLKAEPFWTDTDKGKSLRFELKAGLKWSNDSDLTSDDVKYSFERLKEKQGDKFLGNSAFSEVVENYNLRIISKTEFMVDPNTPKIYIPQLKYMLNFSPISATYFENKSTLDLINAPQSMANEVSSGDFVMPTKAQIDNKEVNNPYKDPNTNVQNIILEKNSKNNINPTWIQKYILKVYPDLINLGLDKVSSVEKASNLKKVDLFVRALGPNTAVNSNEIKNKLGLNQVVLPSNTYYTLFANTQANQNLINLGLRKYTLCSLEKFTVPSLDSYLETIIPLKKILPVQLSQEASMDCGNSKNELLGQKKGEVPIYQANNGKIQLNEENINLNILALENNPILTSLQQKLNDSGIDSTLNLARDLDELYSKIKDKQYNLVLLPNIIVSRDIYPLYGSKSINISSINKNNRMGEEKEKYGEGVDNMLLQYAEQNLENDSLKAKIIDVFKNQYISMNLFRLRYEYNYSNKVRFQEGFDKLVTFEPDIYNRMSVWYIETKRKFKWSN